ncbi:cyclin-like F-box protein [Medicago truncatula]|uniref:Cyclin-like F-box protein n=1 Tax=Medicago truncatula TaxID=3880 RepID=G7L2G1_MEDTR|nr:cyclin-like F-box protein [Medicago truncatula]
MSMMDHSNDFLSLIDIDTSLKIFKCLDDPADLVRVCCVSRSWRHFVVTNGLSKQLCLRMFPQLSRVASVVELNQNGVNGQTDVGSSQSISPALQKDHRVYSYFANSCLSPVAVDCIAKAIGASSTDNFPQESIDHTLDERDNVAGRFSYWSSSGQSNPNVPETLTYHLTSQICVITEINIQPFQAHFQMGSPIYSAKSVRFKMGHLKASLDDLAGETIPKKRDNLADESEKYVWTYTSPEFPMAKENRLQKFTLPEPVLCIGGILQIELLERVQRQEMDGLLYICVAHVQALGIQLSPAFTVDVLGPSGMFVLKRNHRPNCQPTVTSENESEAIITDRHFRQIVTILRAQVMGVEPMDGWDEDEYEIDDDFDENNPL